jgi:hypothetical protein
MSNQDAILNAMYYLKKALESFLDTDEEKEINETLLQLRTMVKHD